MYKFDNILKIPLEGSTFFFIARYMTCRPSIVMYVCMYVCMYVFRDISAHKFYYFRYEVMSDDGRYTLYN